MVDIDGVISLFGFPSDSLQPSGEISRHDASYTRAHGTFHWIEGIPHFLSATAGKHLLVLWPAFELVWASGWEEKANEHLPHLLGLPAPLPYLSFDRRVGANRSANAHWKLDAIDEYGGARPLAWIDDTFNEACHAWARTRPAPTLLVTTAPERGLTQVETDQLLAWSAATRSP